MPQNPSINLIIQYVNDPRPARQVEYEFCLRQNLGNPAVKSVHNLQEHSGIVVPAEFTAHPKYRQFDLNRWLTYSDAFTYANSVLPDEICSLQNLDIFLDPESKWEIAADILKKKIILCLSRTELNVDGTTFVDPILLKWAMATSQDAWIFQTPVSVKDCDFGVGTLGCDNAIAHRIKESGYMPLNASQQLRIYHLDRARGKSLENQEKIYLSERQGAGLGSFPERQGQYLLPDIDMLKSVDHIMDKLKLDDFKRYIVICEVVNKLFHLTNDI